MINIVARMMASLRGRQKPAANKHDCWASGCRLGWVKMPPDRRDARRIKGAMASPSGGRARTDFARARSIAFAPPDR
jgi:hypothetical protein